MKFAKINRTQKFPVLQYIKCLFCANVNVYNVPGLCLLCIGGAPYISHKIIAQEPYFHIFYFFSETTSRSHFMLCEKIA